MQARQSQHGFTLIELLVAMAVTLVVMGAVVGLLTSGQNAFRREPEIIDMQQNLRSAMDLIMRDVGAAGTGIPTDAGMAVGTMIQVFTPGFDNGGACAVAGATACPRPLRPQSTTERTDDLALFVSNSECGAEPICGYMGNASNARIDRNFSCVRNGDLAIFVMADGTWTVREVVSTFDNSGGNGCNTTRVADLSFRQGGSTDQFNPPGGLCNPGLIGTVTGANCTPVAVLGGGEVIGYRIAVGADGVPNLERRSSANRVSGATWANNYQVIARGIEDMQVEYLTAGLPGNPADRTDTWQTQPPLAQTNNYNTLVVGVRVTLAARTSTGVGLAGVAQDARGGQFIRSSLTQTAAVRVALLTASRQFASSPTGNQPAWN